MRRLALAACFAVIVGACSSSDDDDASPSTTEARTTTTVTADPSRYIADVEALADDAMEGRDNQTAGSQLAQEHLIAALREFAQPLGDEFRQPFAEGTNIVALIPGSELPDEYVILGAHYDHLGRTCRGPTPDDDICNGAADNAAGVAAVLEIGRRLAEGEAPRRSVVLAFWDAEEDGLLGARAYLADPLVPLDATTAYLNWDILGANLLPSLSRTTVMVGAETGGPVLVEAAGRAAAASELETLALSLLFGQGRSDHAPFAAAGMPIVFFTDANNACYHTVEDDVAALDVEKLALQIDTGEALARDLSTTDERPMFVTDAPVATHDDAAAMLAVVSRAQPDLGRFAAPDQATVAQFLADLQPMVDAGPEAFDEADVGVLLGGSAALVELLSQGDCDGFVD